MVGTEGHYTKGNKPITEKKYCTIDLYEVSKIVKLVETQNMTVIA